MDETWMKVRLKLIGKILLDLNLVGILKGLKMNGIEYYKYFLLKIKFLVKKLIFYNINHINIKKSHLEVIKRVQSC